MTGEQDGAVAASQPVVVRTARPADDAALAELEAVAWTPESGFPSVQARMAARGSFFGDASPPQACLVAEADGNVAGYLRLGPATPLPENAHVLAVQGLAVHPAARRRGVAAALLTAAAARARERGARKLTLRVLGSNGPALALYERLGFTREGVLAAEFFVNGGYVDDVLMARPLVPQAAGKPEPGRRVS